MRVKVASVDDVPPGSGREFVAGGRIVAVFHVNDQFYALDGICPHAGGPLADGVVNGCVVTCPWHGWQFDVTTGTHCLNPRIRQTQFAVQVEGNDVYVELP